MHTMMVAFLVVLGLGGIVLLSRWFSMSQASTAAYDDEDDVAINMTVMNQTMMGATYGYSYGAMPPVVVAEPVVVVQDDPMLDAMAAGIVADLVVAAAVDVADTVEPAVVYDAPPETQANVEPAPSYDPPSYDSPQDTSSSDSGYNSNDC